MEIALLCSSVHASECFTWPLINKPLMSSQHSTVIYHQHILKVSQIKVTQQQQQQHFYFKMKCEDVWNLNPMPQAWWPSFCWCSTCISIDKALLTPMAGLVTQLTEGMITWGMYFKRICIRSTKVTWAAWLYYDETKQNDLIRIVGQQNSSRWLL